MKSDRNFIIGLFLGLTLTVGAFLYGTNRVTPTATPEEYKTSYPSLSRNYRSHLPGNFE